MTEQKHAITEWPRRSVELHELKQPVEILTEEQTERVQGGRASHTGWGPWEVNPGSILNSGR